VPSTIKIKRSSVAGKKPTTSDISTGELAINTKDFKLFSSNGTAIFELGNAGALANTNARINLINTNLLATNTALRAIDATKLAVSNAATLYATKVSPTTSGLLAHTGRATISTNLAVSGNASVTGTMTASGIISGLELVSTNASGDEGGEVKLTKPPNGTLDGGITIDAYQNKIRFFEQGGSARGAYIDISACAAGATTNLLAGGGSTANGFSGILVGANVIVADTTTDRLTLVAGSRIVLAGNPTTDTITISASTTDYLQVANAASIYQTKAVERAALANTNSYIATRASWTALTGTNTALRTLISDRYQVANVNTLLAAKASWAGLTSTNTALRTLISDRLQVANAASIYQTKAVERAALANTNSSIATQTARVTLVNTNLTGTNTALRTLINARMQVSNVNTLVAARATWTALTGTNTALRTLISDRLQVANASTLYATKVNPATSGLLAHTGRQTISTNLYVSGNTVLGSPTNVSERTTVNGSLFANCNVTISGNTILDGTVTMRGTEASQTLTDAATIAWDTNSGRIATVTLGASRNMGAPTNAKVGTYILHVIQGGIGNYSITWNSVFKWPAGVAPTLSTAVGRRDIFTFIHDGTNFYGTYVNDVR